MFWFVEENIIDYEETFDSNKKKIKRKFIKYY